MKIFHFNERMGIMALSLACLLAIIGALPVLFSGSGARTIIVAGVYLVVSFGFTYFGLPELVGPFFGSVAVWLLFLWVVSAIVVVQGVRRGSVLGKEVASVLFPVVLFVLLVGTLFFTSGMFRASDYARLVIPESRSVWTQDIQPKDPSHMLMGTYENARFLAKKQIGEGGAIGSQFEVKEELMTLQKIRGELWFVVPLDFKQFSTWTSSRGSPGFVMVHAEDPNRPAQYIELPKGQEMVFTPEAFFGDNLNRLVWSKFPTKEIADIHFELDDDNKPWWVVSLAEPTIGWSGKKVSGTVVVNPATGEMTYYPIASVPAWVDRVLPSKLVMENINYWGEYSGGWWNSWWDKADLREAEKPILIYGEGGRPTWVTGITSKNVNDDSLQSVIYTDSHSGQSVLYPVKGGATDKAVVTAVDNHQDVRFKHLHGVTPQLYNVYGRMASIVPLLNGSHAFSGVAIVDIQNVQQIAVGTTPHEAVRKFQQLLHTSGTQIALDRTRRTEVAEGVLDRVSADVVSGVTVYYLYVANVPHLFTGNSEISVKLPVTRVGDKVRIEYYASDESVVPMLRFENSSLYLTRSAAQEKVEDRSAARSEGVRGVREAATIKQGLKSLTPDELRAIERMRGEKK